MTEKSLAAEVERLKTANAALEKLVEEQGREQEAFSSSVAHDLRSRMGTIATYAQILATEFGPQLPGDGAELLQRIDSEIRHMAAMVSGLQQFSRLGRKEIAKRPVDLAAMARDIAFTLGQQQKDRPVEVRIDDLPEGHGEPALIRQLLQHLLSNAFKFTRQRERAAIEVGHRRIDGETAYFVRDNGVGFDMQLAPRLFGMFSRLHDEEEFEGAGVGLTMAKRIVARHGGKIWGEGEVGRGAVFYFTLPDD